MALPDLPRSMRAIAITRPGDADMLKPCWMPVPSPGSDELLIHVAAAGVNRPDVLQRRGLYPVPPGVSPIPGLEVAGEVVAAGPDATRFRIGAKVTALVAGGGYAEYCVAPEVQCLPVPSGLTLVEAASLPETWFTVWANLQDLAGAKAGESLLVHGGTSGIGVTAIDFARLRGLDIIVTAGSDAKCAAALALGARHAINYREADFVAEVARLTGQRGVDILLDMVGGDYVPRNLICLAPRGRHVSIAFQRGATAEVDLALVMRRSILLTGSMLRPRPATEKGAIARALEAEVWPALSDGRLQAHVDRAFALEDAAAAHALMEAGGHIGKIVLTLALPPA